MMSRNKNLPSLWAGLVLSTLVVLLLAGCAAPTPQMVIVTEIVEGEPVEVVVTVPAEGYRSSDPYRNPPADEAGEEEPAEEEAEVLEAFDRPPEVAATVAPIEANEFEPLDSVAAMAAAFTQNRLIIKNADMELLVEDTERAVDRVTTIAEDNGGYVIDSQVWSLDDGRREATLTIAVEAGQFENALRRLRDIALDVLIESSSGVDVSDEYIDLESRLRNLEATQDRVRTFLEQATTSQQALEVNETLSEIEAEIDLIKGRMQYLAGRATFSTINIALMMPAPDVPPTPTPTITPTPTVTPTLTPTPRWNVGEDVEAAVYRQQKTFQRVAGGAIRFILVPLPYLIVLGVIGWGGFRTYRRVRGRPAASAQKAQPAPDDDDS